MTNENPTEQTIEEESFPYTIYMLFFFLFSRFPDIILWICKINWLELCNNIRKIKIDGTEFTNLQDMLELFFRYIRPLLATGALRKVSTKVKARSISKWLSLTVICILVIVRIFGTKFIYFSSEKYTSKIRLIVQSYNDSNTKASLPEKIEQK